MFFDHVTMDSTVLHRILHIIYKKKENLTKEIIDIANAYEGEIKERIGFNFPISFVKKAFPSSTLLQYDAEYVIVYKKGDIHTKRHELQHARYALHPSFSLEVKALWNTFSFDYQQQILHVLRKMNYPDQMDILMDEFQAYYFTEKPNFFGRPS